MKRDEIVALNPGRELDAIIGRNLFGYRLCSVQDVEDYHFFHGKGDVEAYSPLPHYSTDVAAAWEVINMLDKDRHYIEVHTDETMDNRWWCRVSGFTKAMGRTGAESICKAALFAIFRL